MKIHSGQGHGTELVRLRRLIGILGEHPFELVLPTDKVRRSYAVIYTTWGLTSTSGYVETFFD